MERGYTAGKDFYRVLFDNLNDKVAKGSPSLHGQG